MKKIGLLFALCLIPFASASTCESILAGIEETAEASTRVIRTLSMKQGSRQMAQETWQIEQSDAGIEATLLEREGRQPPQNANRGNFPDPNSSVLGIPASLSCEGHDLRQVDDITYELSLIDSDDDNPIESTVMTVKSLGDHVVPVSIVSKAKMTMLIIPVTVNMEISYSDWMFE